MPAEAEEAHAHVRPRHLCSFIANSERERERRKELTLSFHETYEDRTCACRFWRLLVLCLLYSVGKKYPFGKKYLGNKSSLKTFCSERYEALF